MFGSNTALLGLDEPELGLYDLGLYDLGTSLGMSTLGLDELRRGFSTATQQFSGLHLYLQGRGPSAFR